jgi:hypothetical protein
MSETTENSNEDADLETVLLEAENAEQEVSIRHRDMLVYLRAYIDKFVQGNPEVAEQLATDLAQDALADIYQALMDDLDTVEAWDLDDVLEGASLFMLMAIGTRSGKAKAEETSEEQE